MKIITLCFLASMLGLLPGYKSGLANRCVMQEKSVDGTRNGSKAVFSGEVVEVREVNGLTEARLRVIESWKGVKTKNILVLADHLSESPYYQVGKSYLVFASERDGKLFTGQCSRTNRIEYAQEDLKQLGKGKKPKK